MLTPLRLLVWLLPVIIVAAPVAAFAFYLVAVIGNPGSCATEERPVEFSLGAAAEFQRKWDALNASLDAGQPDSAVFSENEATSRARLWVEEHEVPVTDLLICFRDGAASASAKVELPIVPGDVDILVRGTLLLTGETPVADIEEIEVGGLPGPVSDIVDDFVTRLLDNQTEDVALTHDYVLTFAEGEATVSGEPR